MLGTGIKASELIKKLQKEIDKHGDKEVWIPGYDYPQGISGVDYQRRGEGYYHDDVFVVR